ncbi:CXXX repeat peptide modification system protein [Clostridium sp. ATCC 25772]|uniref:CXXX repeat peptide modification system protein n=1 Tax=Clostridium sp. ATCC 25772 TaxID=1676991 RepID=UPI000783CD0C|nr:CXXX repeat peptide modification system protein [Clostridium sp. ATCC 25772]
MSKEIVGKILELEKKEINLLFEKKLALDELKMSLEDIEIKDLDKTEILNRIEKDFFKNNELIESWWNRMSQKYKWKSKYGASWVINFDTNDVCLTE